MEQLSLIDALDVDVRPIISDRFAYRPPAFPSTNFSDFFDRADPYKPNDRHFSPRMAGMVKVSTYLTFSPNGVRRSLNVWVKREILDWISDNMIAVTGDQIYFEGWVGDDGETTLYAKYDQIIGSRKLAELKTSTIPHP